MFNHLKRNEKSIQPLSNYHDGTPDKIAHIFISARRAHIFASSLHNVMPENSNLANSILTFTCVLSDIAHRSQCQVIGVVSNVLLCVHSALIAKVVKVKLNLKPQADGASGSNVRFVFLFSQFGFDITCEQNFFSRWLLQMVP